MSEFFHTDGSVTLVVNGTNKGQVSTGGRNIGDFVRYQAMQYGLKSFSVYVDGAKFGTENAGASLEGVTKVELVAKDSRGSSTWEAEEDWTIAPLRLRTPNVPTTPKGAAPKMKLKFDRKALIASIQATIDDAEAKFKSATEKFEADLAVVTKFVEANAELLAKNFGYKNAADFLDRGKDTTVTSVAIQMAISTRKPSPPDTSNAKAQVVTLSLATDDILEVEEGHPFITHLR